MTAGRVGRVARNDLAVLAAGRGGLEDRIAVRVQPENLTRAEAIASPSPSCQQVTMAPAGTSAAKAAICRSSEPDRTLLISGLMLMISSDAAAGTGLAPGPGHVTGTPCAGVL